MKNLTYSINNFVSKNPVKRFLLIFIFLATFLAINAFSVSWAVITRFESTDLGGNPKSSFGCGERVYFVIESTDPNVPVKYRWSNRISTGPSAWYPSATTWTTLHDIGGGAPVCLNPGACFPCQTGSVGNANCGPYPDISGLPSQSCSEGDPGDVACCNVINGLGSGNFWYNGDYRVMVTTDNGATSRQIDVEWDCDRTDITSFAFTPFCTGSTPSIATTWSLDNVSPAPDSLTFRKCQNPPCVASTTLLNQNSPPFTTIYTDNFTAGDYNKSFKYELTQSRSCDGMSDSVSGNVTVPDCGSCAGFGLTPCGSVGAQRCSGGTNNGNVQECRSQYSGGPTCWETVVTCSGCDVCDGTTFTCNSPTCADFGLQTCDSISPPVPQGDEVCLGSNECPTPRNVSAECARQGGSGCPWCLEETDCGLSSDYCRISNGQCRNTGCGDGNCRSSHGENAVNCPVDCGVCPTCGVNGCESGEDCSNCPADCPCLPGQLCSAGACIYPPATCSMQFQCNGSNCNESSSYSGSPTVSLQVNSANAASGTLKCYFDGQALEYQTVNLPGPVPATWEQNPFQWAPAVYGDYSCTTDETGLDGGSVSCSDTFTYYQCGNGTCDPTETISNCAQDCGCKGISFSWGDQIVDGSDINNIPTRIKASHFEEIRTDIEALRADAGLPSSPVCAGYPTGTIVPGMPISAQYINCFRSAIEEVYTQCNTLLDPDINVFGTSVLNGPWADHPVTTDVPIRRIHIEQLRKAIEEADWVP